MLWVSFFFDLPSRCSRVSFRILKGFLRDSLFFLGAFWGALCQFVLRFAFEMLFEQAINIKIVTKLFFIGEFSKSSCFINLIINQKW